MRSSGLFILAFFAAVVNAHFQTYFPPPRGPFDESKENLFCNGYNTPAANRTQFPLSGGYVTLGFRHGDKWAAAILVSISQTPTPEDKFILHNGYIKGDKPGNYCLPLDFSKSNITGLSTGQNITIQLVWNGGDGDLNQCADVTLASGLDLASKVECRNASVTSSATLSLYPATTSIGKSIPFLTTLVALAGLFLL